MTLDQIIKLFEEIEEGQGDQRIGFHLHESIKQAADQSWETNQNYTTAFSGFLRALKDEKSQ